MSLTQLTANLNIIQTLIDEPNDVGGLTSAQLKAKFDEAANSIKTYINNTLLVELASVTDSDSGADNIGVTSISDLDGVTVQALIESLRNKLKAVTDGSSGADFVKATSISGLTGDTIQSLLESLKSYSDNAFETKSNITTNRKLSETGDFTGTLNGMPIVAADPGLSSTVAYHTEQLAEIMNIQVSFEKFGGLPSNPNNAQAFIDLTTFVNSRGGNCTIVFPPGEYAYKPNDDAVSWRTLTEMVDVKNVTIIGYGATIKQVKDVSWTAGGSHYSKQESPMRFRSTTQFACKNIKIYGLYVKGDSVPYSVGTGDGNCHGFSFRGVYNVIMQDCIASGWGTDGLYVGTTYDDLKSKKVKFVNCDFDINTRQGASIAGCDDFNFTNCSFTNTSGGSFGHGLDLESNAGISQENGIIKGCTFENNQRGALNFIRTSNVIVSDCLIKEQNVNTNGTFYMDGDAENISIYNCNVVCLKAVLYIGGNTGNIKNVRFKNNSFKTTGVPLNSATIRINPNNTLTGIDNISFVGNEFIGMGGFYVKIDGQFFFDNNKMLVNLQASTDPSRFDMTSTASYTYLRNNKIKIESDVVFTAKELYITNGEIKENELISHVNATCYFMKYDTVLIGKNKFSDYFYYKGEHTSLDMKKEGTVTRLEINDNGNQYRVVHGGRQRVLNGINAKFGDITQSNNSNGKVAYFCLTDGSPGVWQIIQSTMKMGVSGSRPGSLGTHDQGLMYLDTTLSANGKLITWNGTAWVDVTGTIV
jgi:hypothetical protein